MFVPSYEHGKVRFSVKQSNTSLLDAFEREEMVSKVDYLRFAEASKDVGVFFDEKLEAYKSIPGSRPDVIATLSDRLVILERMAENIYTLENAGLNGEEIQKEKLLFLLKLNELFRNSEGSSMEYPKYCLHFFQTQL